jgi:hypothetical protein
MEKRADFSFAAESKQKEREMACSQGAKNAKLVRCLVSSFKLVG